MVKSNNELQQSRSRVNQLKKEQETLVRGLNMLEKEKVNYSMQREEQERNMDNLLLQSKALEHEIEKLKREKRELEHLGKKKDKEIADLQQTIQKNERVRNQVETKLKFVNDQLIPKEEKIADLDTHLREAGKEFVGKMRFEQQRDKQVEALRITIQHQQTEIAHVSREKDDKVSYIAKFQMDLHRAIHESHEKGGTDDVKHMVAALKSLYHKYSGEYRQESGESADRRAEAKQEELSHVKELDRQKQMLSRKIMKLSRKTEMQEQVGQKNNMSRIGENALLIQELNEMRRVNKSYLDKIKQLEMSKGDTTPANGHLPPAGTPSGRGAGTPTGTRSASNGVNVEFSSTANSSKFNKKSGKIPPIGAQLPPGNQSGKTLPNAKRQEELREGACADGFPMLISNPLQSSMAPIQAAAPSQGANLK